MTHPGLPKVENSEGTLCNEICELELWSLSLLTDGMLFVPLPTDVMKQRLGQQNTRIFELGLL